MPGLGSAIGDLVGGTYAPIAGGIFDIYNAWSDQSDAAERANEMQALAAAIAQRQAELAGAQFEIDRNLLDRILTQTGDYRQAMIDAVGAMGAYGGSYFDPTELAAETGMRYDIYRDQVDRAIDRVASVEAANRMRSGMDASTLAIDERAAMADQAARSYQDAYARARDEALQYIAGVKQQQYLGQDQMAKQRAGALSEISTVLGSTIPLEAQLYGGGQAGIGGMAYAGRSGSNIYSLLDARAASSGEALGKAIDEFLKENKGRLAEILKGSSGATAPAPTWSPSASSRPWML